MNMKAIEAASNRGMSFHVFSDQPNYIGGEHVGANIYHTSWNSLELAKVIAAKEDNGKVYNSQGKRIV